MKVSVYLKTHWHNLFSPFTESARRGINFYVQILNTFFNSNFEEWYLNGCSCYESLFIPKRPFTQLNCSFYKIWEERHWTLSFLIFLREFFLTADSIKTDGFHGLIISTDNLIDSRDTIYLKTCIYTWVYQILQSSWKVFILLTED